MAELLIGIFGLLGFVVIFAQAVYHENQIDKELLNESMRVKAYCWVFLAALLRIAFYIVFAIAAASCIQTIKEYLTHEETVIEEQAEPLEGEVVQRFERDNFT